MRGVVHALVLLALAFTIGGLVDQGEFTAAIYVALLYLLLIGYILTTKGPPR